MEGSSGPNPPHFIFTHGFPDPNICDMNVLEPLAQAALESSISSSSSSSTLDVDLNAEDNQASPRFALIFVLFGFLSNQSFGFS